MKSSETNRERGSDAGRVNRRRRHILMDTMGPLLMVLVFSANAQDQDGGARVAVAVPCRHGAYLFGQSANYFRLNFRSHS